MKTVIEEKTIYTYDELSDEAKEKAREWFISGYDHEQWWDSVYDDAKTVAALFGLDINKIYFSGFWSQGDGACFEGSYRYETGGLRAVKEYAPQDEELHNIVLMLQRAQVANFYQVYGTVSHRGHYYHSGCMSFDLIDNRGYRYGIKDKSSFEDVLRRFADWIYERLENEWDYLTSDECVEESIRANEYQFLEDGNVY